MIRCTFHNTNELRKYGSKFVRRLNIHAVFQIDITLLKGLATFPRKDIDLAIAITDKN